MAGAPKAPTKFTTKRIINPSFAKKVKGGNTYGEIKQNLRDVNKRAFELLYDTALKTKNPERYLLSKGLDIRKLYAMGLDYNFIAQIFGYEKTARELKLGDETEKYCKALEYTCEFPGGSKRYTTSEISSMLAERTDEVIRTLGLKNIINDIGFDKANFLFDLKSRTQEGSIQEVAKKWGLSTNEINILSKNFKILDNKKIKNINKK